MPALPPIDLINHSSVCMAGTDAENQKGAECKSCRKLSCFRACIIVDVQAM